MSKNNFGKTRDTYQIAIDNRRKDSKDFLKNDFDDIKVINNEEVEKMWDWELIYCKYYCGMGTVDRYNEIGIVENWKINYYRKYLFHYKTGEDVGPSILALKSFKWIEDYDYKKRFDYYHHNKDLKTTDEYKLKNFEVVGLEFWNFVLVNKKYFDDYNHFIKELLRKYDILRENYFWLNITTVSKIFHSNNKEKFLTDQN